MDIFVIMLTAFVLYIAEGELYRRLWSKGLNAEIEITPKAAFKGDKGTMSLTISNRKLLPLPWLWVKLHISSSLHFDGTERSADAYIYHNSLFCIMGWQEIRRKLNYTCTKRGYFPLRSFEVVGTSILFNGKHTKSYTSPAALTVYPQLISAEEIESLMFRFDGILSRSGFTNPDPFEFAGIREYMPTDSLRDINFKASAHTGTLMSNTHNPTVRGELAIILCFKVLKEDFVEERFEYAISLAATLADRYALLGFNVSLISNGIDLAVGESVSIESGFGGTQLQNIYESLARISYTDTVDETILAPQGESTASAVFISPTVDLSVLSLYDNTADKYSNAIWLMPVMEFDMPRTRPPASGAVPVPVPPEIRS